MQVCELLGICVKTPVDVRDYLKTFYSHSVRHPHGWGLMREKDGKSEIIKEPVCASGSRIISETIRKTEPLDNEQWTQFPMTQLLAFKNGERVFEGTVHGNEFIPTLEYISTVDAMNI